MLLHARRTIGVPRLGLIELGNTPVPMVEQRLRVLHPAIAKTHAERSEESLSILSLDMVVGAIR